MMEFRLKKSSGRAFFLLLMLCAVFSGKKAFAQGASFIEGEHLFRQNQPQEAVPLLREAITNGESPTAYIYLALAYYQLTLYDDALEVCSAGMLANGTNKKILAYNGGNISFAIEDYESAEKWYSLALTVDTTYAPAVLNRAQSRLKLGKFKDSRDDYRKYLILEPRTEQKEPIEELLAILDEEIAAQDARSGMGVPVYIQGGGYGGEGGYSGTGGGYGGGSAGYGGQGGGYGTGGGAQSAADSQALADAERRRRLLEEVAASLQGTGAENMSAGAEGTVDYGYESELE